MTKKKVLLLIPLLIIGGLIAYTWITLFGEDYTPIWRHYVALGLFVVLVFLFVKNFTKAVLATGLYLILGTCNLLTLTASTVWNSFGVNVGSAEIWTPSFQLLSFGLFVLFFILNFDTLTDIYLDYKEAGIKKEMVIEPFGVIKYLPKEKEWCGLVNNVTPNTKTELCIEVDTPNEDISEKIELMKQFASDYNSIVQSLYDLLYQSGKGSDWEKSLEEIKQMYFLTAVSLKSDNKTWWLVLEPHSNVPSIHNHFYRFTMVGRQITWTNFT